MRLLYDISDLGVFTVLEDFILSKITHPDNLPLTY